MSNQAKIAKVVDPYAEALISFRINPKTVIGVLDILQTHQDHFLNPRVSTVLKKNIINVLRGSYNPFLLQLCIMIIEKEKSELLCPILERYLVLCNSLDRIKSMKVTSTIPLDSKQKKINHSSFEFINSIKKDFTNQCCGFTNLWRVYNRNFDKRC